MSKDDDEAAAVERHLEGCGECREWLETYRSIAAGLGSDRADLDAHPSSAALASLAAEGDGRTGDPATLEHLGACPSCQELVAVTRSAITEADGAPAADRKALGRWAALAAAALLLVALGIALSVERGAGEPQRVEAADYRISDVSLSGVRQIEAARSLSVSSVQVEHGARVRFRAGQRVALGDGFSVGPEADFAIELSQPKQVGRAEARN